MLTTRLLVTASGAAMAEAHEGVLTVLANAFSENIFTEIIPELMSTSYLGPDPEALALSKDTQPDKIHETSVGGGTGQSSNTVAIIMSLGCVVLLLSN